MAFYLSYTEAFYAHVKWFSEFSFQEKPNELSDLIKPLNIFFIFLSIIVFSVFLMLDEKISRTQWMQKTNGFLSSHREKALDIIRFSICAVLLLSWQADSLLVPKLEIKDHSWLGWMQFFTIFLLFFRKTLIYASFSLLFLFFMGTQLFGFFYMLDYTNILGVIYYLFTSRLKNEKLRASGVPVLFFTLGFSLYWLGFEKLYYPGWSNYLLELHPVLTLGLPAEFFLPAAAFVEIGLGYLLIQGIFERPLAIIITLVFLLTSMVFGKVEIIGHTLLHATLIVFLLEGKGTFSKPPAYFYDTTLKRSIFVSLSYLIFTFILGALYSIFSHTVHHSSQLH